MREKSSLLPTLVSFKARGNPIIREPDLPHMTRIPGNTISLENKPQTAGEATIYTSGKQSKNNKVKINSFRP